MAQALDPAEFQLYDLGERWRRGEFQCALALSRTLAGARGWRVRLSQYWSYGCMLFTCLMIVYAAILEDDQPEFFVPIFAAMQIISSALSLLCAVLMGVFISCFSVSRRFGLSSSGVAANRLSTFIEVYNYFAPVFTIYTAQDLVSNLAKLHFRDFSLSWGLEVDPTLYGLALLGFASNLFCYTFSTSMERFFSLRDYHLSTRAFVLSRILLYIRQTAVGVLAVFLGPLTFEESGSAIILFATIGCSVVGSLGGMLIVLLASYSSTSLSGFWIVELVVLVGSLGLLMFLLVGTVWGLLLATSVTCYFTFLIEFLVARYLRSRASRISAAIIQASCEDYAVQRFSAAFSSLEALLERPGGQNPRLYVGSSECLQWIAESGRFSQEAESGLTNWSAGLSVAPDDGPAGLGISAFSRPASRTESNAGDERRFKAGLDEFSEEVPLELPTTERDQTSLDVGQSSRFNSELLVFGLPHAHLPMRSSHKSAVLPPNVAADGLVKATPLIGQAAPAFSPVSRLYGTPLLEAFPFYSGKRRLHPFYLLCTAYIAVSAHSLDSVSLLAQYIEYCIAEIRANVIQHTIENARANLSGARPATGRSKAKRFHKAKRSREAPNHEAVSDRKGAPDGGPAPPDSLVIASPEGEGEGEAEAGGPRVSPKSPPDRPSEGSPRKETRGPKTPEVLPKNESSLGVEPFAQKSFPYSTVQQDLFCTVLEILELLSSCTGVGVYRKLMGIIGHTLAVSLCGADEPQFGGMQSAPYSPARAGDIAGLTRPDDKQIPADSAGSAGAGQSKDCVVTPLVKRNSGREHVTESPPAPFSVPRAISRSEKIPVCPDATSRTITSMAQHRVGEFASLAEEAQAFLRAVAQPAQTATVRCEEDGFVRSQSPDAALWGAQSGLAFPGAARGPPEHLLRWVTEGARTIDPCRLTEMLRWCIYKSSGLNVEPISRVSRVLFAGSRRREAPSPGKSRSSKPSTTGQIAGTRSRAADGAFSASQMPAAGPHLTSTSQRRGTARRKPGTAPVNSSPHTPQLRSRAPASAAVSASIRHSRIPTRSLKSPVLRYSYDPALVVSVASLVTVPPFCRSTTVAFSAQIRAHIASVTQLCAEYLNCLRVVARFQGMERAWEPQDARGVSMVASESESSESPSQLSREISGGSSPSLPSPRLSKTRLPVLASPSVSPVTVMGRRRFAGNLGILENYGPARTWDSRSRRPQISGEPRSLRVFRPAQESFPRDWDRSAAEKSAVLMVSMMLRRQSKLLNKIQRKTIWIYRHYPSCLAASHLLAWVYHDVFTQQWPLDQLALFPFIEHLDRFCAGPASGIRRGASEESRGVLGTGIRVTSPRAPENSPCATELTPSFPVPQRGVLATISGSEDTDASEVEVVPLPPIVDGKTPQFTELTKILTNAFPDSISGQDPANDTVVARPGDSAEPGSSSGVGEHAAAASPANQPQETSEQDVAPPAVLRLQLEPNNPRLSASGEESPSWREQAHSGEFTVYGMRSNEAASREAETLAPGHGDQGTHQSIAIGDFSATNLMTAAGAEITAQPASGGAQAAGSDEAGGDASSDAIRRSAHGVSRTAVRFSFTDMKQQFNSQALQRYDLPLPRREPSAVFPQRLTLAADTQAHGRSSTMMPRARSSSSAYTPVARRYGSQAVPSNPFSGALPRSMSWTQLGRVAAAKADVSKVRGLSRAVRIPSVAKLVHAGKPVKEVTPDGEASLSRLTTHLARLHNQRSAVHGTVFLYRLDGGKICIMPPLYRISYFEVLPADLSIPRERRQAAGGSYIGAEGELSGALRRVPLEAQTIALQSFPRGRLPVEAAGAGAQVQSDSALNASGASAGSEAASQIPIPASARTSLCSPSLAGSLPSSGTTETLGSVSREVGEILAAERELFGPRLLPLQGSSRSLRPDGARLSFPTTSGMHLVGGAAAGAAETAGRMQAPERGSNHLQALQTDSFDSASAFPSRGSVCNSNGTEASLLSTAKLRPEVLEELAVSVAAWDVCKLYSRLGIRYVHVFSTDVVLQPNQDTKKRTSQTIRGSFGRQLSQPSLFALRGPSQLSPLEGLLAGGSSLDRFFYAHGMSQVLIRYEDTLQVRAAGSTRGCSTGRFVHMLKSTDRSSLKSWRCSAVTWWVSALMIMTLIGAAILSSKADVVVSAGSSLLTNSLNYLQMFSGSTMSLFNFRLRIQKGPLGPEDRGVVSTFLSDGSARRVSIAMFQAAKTFYGAVKYAPPFDMDNSHSWAEGIHFQTDRLPVSAELVVPYWQERRSVLRCFSVYTAGSMDLDARAADIGPYLAKIYGGDLPDDERSLFLNVLDNLGEIAITRDQDLSIALSSLLLYPLESRTQLTACISDALEALEAEVSYNILPHVVMILEQAKAVVDTSHTVSLVMSNAMTVFHWLFAGLGVILLADITSLPARLQSFRTHLLSLLMIRSGSACSSEPGRGVEKSLKNEGGKTRRVHAAREDQRAHRTQGPGETQVADKKHSARGSSAFRRREARLSRKDRSSRASRHGKRSKSSTKVAGGTTGASAAGAESVAASNSGAAGRTAEGHSPLTAQAAPVVPLDPPDPMASMNSVSAFFKIEPTRSFSSNRDAGSISLSPPDRSDVAVERDSAGSTEKGAAEGTQQNIPRASSAGQRVTRIADRFRTEPSRSATGSSSTDSKVVNLFDQLPAVFPTVSSEGSLRATADGWSPQSPAASGAPKSPEQRQSASSPLLGQSLDSSVAAGRTVYASIDFRTVPVSAKHRRARRSVARRAFFTFNDPVPMEDELPLIQLTGYKAVDEVLISQGGGTWASLRSRFARAFSLSQILFVTAGICAFLMALTVLLMRPTVESLFDASSLAKWQSELFLEPYGGGGRRIRAGSTPDARDVWGARDVRQGALEALHSPKAFPSFASGPKLDPGFDYSELQSESATSGRLQTRATMFSLSGNSLYHILMRTIESAEIGSCSRILAAANGAASASIGEVSRNCMIDYPAYLLLARMAASSSSAAVTALTASLSHLQITGMMTDSAIMAGNLSAQGDASAGGPVPPPQAATASQHYHVRSLFSEPRSEEMYDPSTIALAGGLSRGFQAYDVSSHYETCQTRLFSYAQGMKTHPVPAVAYYRSHSPPFVYFLQDCRLSSALSQMLVPEDLGKSRERELNFFSPTAGNRISALLTILCSLGLGIVAICIVTREVDFRTLFLPWQNYYKVLKQAYAPWTILLLFCSGLFIVAIVIMMILYGLYACHAMALRKSPEVQAANTVLGFSIAIQPHIHSIARFPWQLGQLHKGLNRLGVSEEQETSQEHESLSGRFLGEFCLDAIRLLDNDYMRTGWISPTQAVKDAVSQSGQPLEVQLELERLMIFMGNSLAVAALRKYCAIENTTVDRLMSDATNFSAVISVETALHGEYAGLDASSRGSTAESHLGDDIVVYESDRIIIDGAAFLAYDAIDALTPEALDEYLHDAGEKEHAFTTVKSLYGSTLANTVVLLEGKYTKKLQEASEFKQVMSHAIHIMAAICLVTCLLLIVTYNVYRHLNCSTPLATMRDSLLTSSEFLMVSGFVLLVVFLTISLCVTTLFGAGNEEQQIQAQARNERITTAVAYNFLSSCGLFFPEKRFTPMELQHSVRTGRRLASLGRMASERLMLLEWGEKPEDADALGDLAGETWCVVKTRDFTDDPWLTDELIAVPCEKVPGLDAGDSREDLESPRTTLKTSSEPSRTAVYDYTGFCAYTNEVFQHAEALMDWVEERLEEIPWDSSRSYSLADLGDPGDLWNPNNSLGAIRTLNLQLLLEDAGTLPDHRKGGHALVFCATAVLMLAISCMAHLHSRKLGNAIRFALNIIPVPDSPDARASAREILKYYDDIAPDLKVH